MVASSCARGPDADWTSEFPLLAEELTSTGRNPWFILEPGYTLVLAEGGDTLVITVLDETELVDGIETRVVEERESEDGELVEVSRNFFAISRRTNSVFYFGEDVDEYNAGAVSAHPGEWRSGRGDARYGLMMPGLPLLGARFYQEVAPGVAMDRAEIESLADTLVTAVGSLRGLLRLGETTPLEPGVRESKWYAAGIGLVRDGSLRLVRYGPSSR